MSTGQEGKTKKKEIICREIRNEGWVPHRDVPQETEERNRNLLNGDLAYKTTQRILKFQSHQMYCTTTPDTEYSAERSQLLLDSYCKHFDEV